MDHTLRISDLAAPLNEAACPGCGVLLDTSGQLALERIACPECEAVFDVPSKVDRYVLSEVLGEGAMGMVIRGEDVDLARPVALKFIRPGESEAGKLGKLLRAEARALAALQHPHICAIHTIGECKGSPFLVMELLEGGSLKERMAKRGPLTETETLCIALDICTGLAAASRAGLVHGDIKPENILFSNDGKAKIVDFGLAGILQSTEEKKEVYGTPYYVAPEQARGEECTFRTDMYSLGVTLWYALAGCPPFDGPTPLQTITARLNREPPRVSEVVKGLTVETDALLFRMMQVDPRTRHATYDSLLADLRAALAAVAHRGVEQAPEPIIGGVRRIPLMIFGSLAVAGIGLGIALLMEPSAPSPVVPPSTSNPSSPPPVTARQVSPAQSAPLPRVTAVEAPLSPPSPTVAPDGFVTITTQVGVGSDAYIQGVEGDKDNSRRNFGFAQIVWVKADADEGRHLSRKAYLRFDLAEYRERLAGINSLRVIFTAVSGSNMDGVPHEIWVWGLDDEEAQRAWVEGRPDASTRDDGRITWSTAPGNAHDDKAEMASPAFRIGAIPAPATFKEDTTWYFSHTEMENPAALLDYVRRDEDGIITFMLTARPTTGQRSGWKFHSKEGQPDKAPRIEIGFAE
jgi:serine/threonine protein kinase